MYLLQWKYYISAKEMLEKVYVDDNFEMVTKLILPSYVSKQVQEEAAHDMAW